MALQQELAWHFSMPSLRVRAPGWLYRMSAALLPRPLLPDLGLVPGLALHQGLVHLPLQLQVPPVGVPHPAVVFEGGVQVGRPLPSQRVLLQLQQQLARVNL